MDFSDLLRAADRMNVQPMTDAESREALAHLNEALAMWQTECAWRTRAAFERLESLGRPMTEAEFRRAWGED